MSQFNELLLVTEVLNQPSDNKILQVRGSKTCCAKVVSLALTGQLAGMV